MKCLFCHQKVPRGSVQCPHCGWDAAPGHPAPARATGWNRWKNIDGRRLILGLLAGAVVVGLVARSLGSGDPSPRFAAREEAGDGITALLGQRYHDAVDHLSLALRHDDGFAEGWLARGMAHLALGQLDAARHDAARAAALFQAGQVDAQAWRQGGGAEEGQRIAERTACVADAAAEASDLRADDFKAVFQILYEVRQHEACAQAEATLRQWQTERRAYDVVSAALTRCPELWRCTR